MIGLATRQRDTIRHHQILLKSEMRVQLYQVVAELPWCHRLIPHWPGLRPVAGAHDPSVRAPETYRTSLSPRDRRLGALPSLANKYLAGAAGPGQNQAG